MNDIKTKAKMEVLQELIDLMKNVETDQLKEKSMSFKRPEPKEVVPDVAAIEVEIPDESETEDDDEDTEKLKEIYSRLK